MTINELIESLEKYKQDNHLDGNQEIIFINEDDTAHYLSLGPAYIGEEIDTRYVFMY